MHDLWHEETRLQTHSAKYHYMMPMNLVKLNTTQFAFEMVNFSIKSTAQ